MIEWVHGADSLVVREIRERAKAIEVRLGTDFLTYSGPINDGAHALLKDTVESIGKIGKRRRRLMVHLETGGGYIESAERIANTFRHHYQQ